MYPKEETLKEKEARLLRLRHLEEKAIVQRIKGKNITGVLAVTGFPSVCFMIMGFFWPVMNTSIAVTSVISSVLFSIGVLLAVGVGADWWKL